MHLHNMMPKLNWAILQYLFFKILSNKNKLLGKCPLSSLNNAISRSPLYGFMLINIHAVVYTLICFDVCFGFALLKYLPFFFFFLFLLELWLFLLVLAEYSRKITTKNLLITKFVDNFFLKRNIHMRPLFTD